MTLTPSPRRRDVTASFHAGDAQNPDRWMLHQAANDGFRGLFLVCFDGPSATNGPRGLVVLSNGDNDAMLFNCAMARAMLEGLGLKNKPFTLQNGVPRSVPNGSTTAD